jgi:hypothetical protein
MRAPAAAAALLGLAWLASFTPPALPPLAALHWPAQWARHVAAGWPPLPALAPFVLGWLIAGALLVSLPGAAQAWRSLAIAAGGVIAVRFTWLAPLATNAELVGALLALAAWPLAERLPPAWLARALAAGVAALLVLARQEPFAGGAHAGAHWVPFTDLAPAGAPLAFVAHLAARVYWSGGLVWLLVAAGLGAFAAGLGVAGALTALAAVRFAAGAGVPYSTTDATIALVAALAIALLARWSGRR